MLELQAIGKRLGAFRIAELSLEVMPGEYFVLLGPSGVGKTVLLEMIAGLIRPDQGRILWIGQDITRTPPEKRRFAMVYQDYALFPHLNVEQNIGYSIRVSGLGRKQAAQRIRPVAEMLQIEGLLSRRVASLSGGEQQRVALARALVSSPQLLLLDEPLAALDTTSRIRLRKELKQIQQRTATTLVHVTHDLDEAMSLGDRIGVMLQQRVHQVGTPEELFRHPSDYEVARFLGMRNVLAVSRVCEGICEAEGVRIHAAGVDPSTKHLWIRPEEILLSLQPFDSSALNQFPCEVVDWEPQGSLVAIRVAIGRLHLVALVTYTSFQHLAIQAGTHLYATFKSSAVHGF